MRNYPVAQVVAVFTIHYHSTEQTEDIILNISLFTFTRTRPVACFCESAQLTGSNTTSKEEEKEQEKS